MLKISLLFKKYTTFTGESLKNFQDKVCEIFRILALHKSEQIGRFSNLYQCTFKVIYKKSVCQGMLSLSSIRIIFSVFVIKATEGLNITRIIKLIEYHPEKYSPFRYLIMSIITDLFVPCRYLIMSIITDSFVPCNDAIVAQCFVRFSIVDKSCGGILANFNNHSCVIESKAFWQSSHMVYVSFQGFRFF